MALHQKGIKMFSAFALLGGGYIIQLTEPLEKGQLPAPLRFTIRAGHGLRHSSSMDSLPWLEVRIKQKLLPSTALDLP